MADPATHRVTVDGLEMDLDDNGEIVRILDHAGDGGSDAMTWAERSLRILDGLPDGASVDRRAVEGGQDV